MHRGALVLLAIFATDLAAQAPQQKLKANTPPFAQPDGRRPILPRGPGQPPEYVKFDFNGNPEQMLAEFLKTKAGQDLVQDLWKKLQEQPTENVKKMLEPGGPNIAEVGKFVEELLKGHPDLKAGKPLDFDAATKDLMEKFNVKDIDKKALAEMVMKSLEKKLGPESMPKIDDLLAQPKPGEGADLNLPNLENLLDEEFALDDRLGEWLSELLKDENFLRTMDGLFKDAPGLQDAFGDLVSSLKAPDANGNWMPKIPDFGGGKWNFDFKPPKMPFELGQLPKLPSLRMPQLPRLNLPMPRLGNFGLPRMPGFGGVPNVNMPAAPNVSGGREWVYIVLVIAAGGLAWWFLRRVQWSPRSPHAQVAALLRSLPTSITTRTQLQKAFDTLALMRLGDQARAWNHRLIARQLGDAAPMTDAAQAFASLYEIARYTPGDDRLSRAEQDAVRDSLAVLTAGVA